MQHNLLRRTHYFLLTVFIFSTLCFTTLATAKVRKTEKQSTNTAKSKSKLTENVYYLEVNAKKGDGIANLLKRYNLEQDKNQMDLFKELNKKALGKSNQIYDDRKYKLPILVFKKGSKKKICKENEIDLKKLEIYNRKLESNETKDNFKDIWIPTNWLNDDFINSSLNNTIEIKKDELKPQKKSKPKHETIDSVTVNYNKTKKISKAEEKVINDSILLSIANKFTKKSKIKKKKAEEKETHDSLLEDLSEKLKDKKINKQTGKKFQDNQSEYNSIDTKQSTKYENNFLNLLGKTPIKRIDNKLKNYAFYLDAGHGGPDPGAIGNRDGKELHEDEYAYDITLRLAKKLYESGATIFMIVQDDADGIRDDKYLNNSFDEEYFGKVKIDRNQKVRLNKRAEIVNNLYAKNKKIKHHYGITIHIDSRDEGKRVDIFCYHKEGNSEGKKLAETLVNKIEEKYDKAQPGRGYQGSVSSRSLLMLRKNIPTSIYFELGNIQNPKDQIRFIDSNNRQAISNWLYEGILDFDKSKGK